MRNSIVRHIADGDNSDQWPDDMPRVYTSDLEAMGLPQWMVRRLLRGHRSVATERAADAWAILFEEGRG